MFRNQAGVVHRQEDDAAKLMSQKRIDHDMGSNDDIKKKLKNYGNLSSNEMFEKSPDIIPEDEDMYIEKFSVTAGWTENEQ